MASNVNISDASISGDFSLSSQTNPSSFENSCTGLVPEASGARSVGAENVT